MKRFVLPIAVMLATTACAQAPPETGPAAGMAAHAATEPRSLLEDPAQPAPYGEAVPPSPAGRAAGTAVNVVGTPIYAVLKGAVCVASFAMAVPMASLVELTDRPDRRQWRATLYEGVGRNCGGSYVLDAS